MRWLAIATTLLVALCDVTVTRAAVVTFDFEGQVTQKRGVGEWLAQVGDTFTGRFSYDTSTPETGDAYGNRHYQYYYPTVDPPVEFWVEINGTTLSSLRLTYHERDFGYAGGTNQVNLSVGSDRVGVGRELSVPFNSMGITLYDHDGTSRFGFVDPENHSRSFSDLSPFEDADIGFNSTALNGEPRLVGSLTRLELYSPTKNIIPAPSSLTCMTGVFAMAVIAGWWRRRKSH